ncbi:short-chain dehydrogenase/reductase family protein [Cavenderia fasciculata]|uniref:Short-chain dehydrogenase/reductase family protein n=1 Tax=Cavenderia fasciculata TaxID=261658 RepID=F4PVU6_CACFS|nr:short-chain dehydrogenase/reductase family protein [Cavenderia fasciculata]EGG20110.1 short-chain dehydrogenase/reductase family protein [Cavenderia fasciculata]|eukprot:XP_004367093.1 short-chain dehydrogenase/reductase family protein [Cavenderia fasciculata]
METISSSKVVFVVGSSTGVGLAVTKHFLNNGYRVAATARSKETLIKAVGIQDGSSSSSSFLALEDDLQDDEKINQTIQQVMKHFGRIDIVLFNAGKGLLGTVEEISDQELKEVFNINFFACASVLRHVTKHLESGAYVFTTSSIVAVLQSPIIGAYCATKSAMDGLVVSYAKEVEPLGIRCTTLNLGGFDSQFAQAAQHAAANLKERYAATYQPFPAFVKSIEKKDPNNIGPILLEMVNRCDRPAPSHLFIGLDAINISRNVYGGLEKEIDQFEHLTALK